MEYLADNSFYSDQVVALFDAPRHAARPADANHVGSAVSKPRASEIAVYLKVTDGKVESAGFEALACPHTIAAAELVCRDLAGRELAGLAAYDAAFLDAALPLPAEKIDIRILLEDAVRSVTKQADAKGE